MKISKINKCYLNNDFSLEIHDLILLKNNINVLLGLNGSGKSTLLKEIVQLKTTSFNKANLMLQSPYIFKGSVLDNINYAKTLNKSKINPSKIIKTLKLDDIKNIDASTISGGQRQRLALGMSLVSGADLILLDEPFNNVDYLSYQIMIDTIKDCKQITFLIVTHQLNELLAYVKCFHILEKGVLVYSGNDKNYELIKHYLRKEDYDVIIED